MDCVEGKKGTKKTMLVLTERYTRYEIIRIMKDHTAASVVNTLNGIERVTPADTRRLEKWISNYPRGIFNYFTSADLYEACVNSLLSA